MLKKIAIGFISLLVVLVVAVSMAGFPPAFILNAPGVATGIGAKLLCSSRFVTGFSEAQSFDDLVQYSPLLEMLEVETDVEARRVKATFLGISSKTASYIPGLGCSVDYPDYSQRESINIGPSPRVVSAWPLGEEVETHRVPMDVLLESLVEKDNSEGLNTRALLVVHRGEIVAEAYGQNADENTPLLGWSMAKSITAVMLGNLEMRGLLDLNSTPGFPQWASDERSSIKITDLLTMSDGLSFSEDYNPGDDATTMLFTSPSASDFTIAKSAAHPPGSRFNYSSGTANVLSRIYSDTLGGPELSYSDYLRNIAGPLGFHNATFEVDASGVFFGSSYLYASARDWARLGQLMLNGGTINGSRLVTEDWVQRATSPNQTENHKAYGYQWWLNRGDEQLRWVDIPADAFAANGNRQQHLMVIPSADAVIVRLGWTAGRYPINQRFSEILAAL